MLKVELSREEMNENGEKVLTVLKRSNVNPINFFQFTMLPRGQYTLAVRSTLSPRLFVIQTNEVKVNLDNSTQFVRLTFDALPPKEIQEVGGGSSLFPLLLIVGTIVFILYFEQARTYS